MSKVNGFWLLCQVLIKAGSAALLFSGTPRESCLWRRRFGSWAQSQPTRRGFAKATKASAGIRARRRCANLRPRAAEFCIPR